MNEKGEKEGDRVIKRLIYLLVFFLFFSPVSTKLVFAQEEPEKKKTKKLPAVSPEAGELPAISPEAVEPFEVSSQFKKEEIEPPEIEVTGIMETEQGIVAIVELDLEDYEGTAMLEPGQKVSMPDPESSVADKWISYFTVKEIKRSGIIIVLENGQEAYFPVLGSRD